MTYAMLCPDGGIILIASLFVILACVACLAALVAVAVYATIDLAKWAAARHNRLAAKES